MSSWLFFNKHCSQSCTDISKVTSAQWWWIYCFFKKLIWNFGLSLPTPNPPGRCLEEIARELCSAVCKIYGNLCVASLCTDTFHSGSAACRTFQRANSCSQKLSKLIRLQLPAGGALRKEKLQEASIFEYPEEERLCVVLTMLFFSRSIWGISLIHCDSTFN